MQFVGYCPVCGDIDLGIEQDKEHKCLYCNHETIITKYSLEEYFKNRTGVKQILKEFAKNSPEFDEELARKREEENDKVLHGRGTPMSSQQNVPKCPTCGSTNIKHITTLNRAVSVGILGLLSGKIGKNYECLNCKAKW